MKGKNIFRIFSLTIFILFTTLYIIQALGYYEYSNRKTNQLTEEAVKKFDADIKAGKNVKASDYIKKENDYNNNISRMGLTLSNTVGDIFDGIMSFIFSGIDKTVNG
ncbi:MAG: hypothetical protein Q4E39_04745 [bacterium]|nr:hypothetical protein [bacterium]